MLLQACPYYTMFPLEFPLRYLRHAKPGDWVLDPFCGRGTTLYAARLLGLPASGVDISPVAAAVADAMLASASPEAVISTCGSLLKEAPEPTHVPKGKFWEYAYHPRTLRELCRVREALLSGGPLDSARRLLRLVLLGRMHGPLRKTIPTYLSNQMPRTFAPKPAYSVRFWKKNRLFPPEVSVLDVVRRKAPCYIVPDPPSAGGAAARGDSRVYDFLTLGGPYSWIITSPPYYGMRTYVPDQWLRHWFLGGPPVVSYEYAGQLGSGGPEAFVEGLRQVWQNVARASKPGATLVVRFGALISALIDPVSLFRETLKGTPWRLTDIVPAGHAEEGRRQAHQFTKRIRHPVSEVDFVARLP